MNLIALVVPPRTSHHFRRGDGEEGSTRPPCQPAPRASGRILRRTTATSSRSVVGHQSSTTKLPPHWLSALRCALHTTAPLHASLLLMRSSQQALQRQRRRRFGLSPPSTQELYGSATTGRLLVTVSAWMAPQPCHGRWLQGPHGWMTSPTVPSCTKERSCLSSAIIAHSSLGHASARLAPLSRPQCILSCPTGTRPIRGDECSSS